MEARALIESYPFLVNQVVQVVKATAESLEQLPADESAEMLAEAFRGVDGKKLGEAVNAVSQLLIAVHQASPGLLAQSRVGVISDAAAAVDFGQLRVALTEHCHSCMAVLEGKVDSVVGSPLALANLLNVVPQIANDLIRITAKALGYMKLPDELLASALFTLVRDIDMREVADAVNAASGLVVALSRGDRILGGVNEPFFKKVLSEMMDEAAAGIDGDLLKEAGLALGSDLKVIGEVVSERVSIDTDAEKLERTVQGLVDRLVEAALRNGGMVRAVLRPVFKGLVRYVAAIIKRARVLRFFKKKA